MSESKKNKPSTKLRKKIYQSNPLIQAKKGMNSLELRLFAIGLQGVNPHLSEKDKFFDKEFKPTYISTADLTKIFGGNTRYLHDLDKVCEHMFHNDVIHLRYEDGGFCLMHMFSRLEYKPNDGLYIKFDENMRPYLLDLINSGGYTQITVAQIFTLTSPYAWRLVELMLQFKGTKKVVIERTITIEDLRFSLNVPNDAYVGRINNFRNKVLDEPIDEINHKTSYFMTYRVIKKGRNVAAFEFLMDTSKVIQAEIEAQKAAENAIAIEQDIISIIKSFGIREEIAKQLLHSCNNAEDCRERLKYAEAELLRQSQFRTIKNKAGFIIDAIRENWFKKSKESANITNSAPENQQNDLERRYWLKLMNKFRTASEEMVKRRSGIKRMLTEEEIQMLQDDLFEGSLSYDTKEMLDELGWDHGLAIDIFSFNPVH